MDITDTLAPTSDQLDAIDLRTSGPRTFTVTGASKGNPEQPVQIALAEFDRVWRPSKGMRRVLAAAWGTDASAWTGHRVTLFCDDTVTFGKERPGGVRISHLSHIAKALDVPLMVTRGKSAIYTVQPLLESSTDPASALKDTGHAGDVEPSIEAIAECTDLGVLRDWWKVSGPTKRKLIEARKTELEAEPMESLLDGAS